MCSEPAESHNRTCQTQKASAALGLRGPYICECWQWPEGESLLLPWSLYSKALLFQPLRQNNKEGRCVVWFHLTRGCCFWIERLGSQDTHCSSAGIAHTSTLLFPWAFSSCTPKSPWPKAAGPAVPTSVSRYSHPHTKALQSRSLFCLSECCTVWCGTLIPSFWMLMQFNCFIVAPEKWLQIPCLGVFLPSDKQSNKKTGFIESWNHEGWKRPLRSSPTTHLPLILPINPWPEVPHLQYLPDIQTNFSFLRRPLEMLRAEEN